MASKKHIIFTEPHRGNDYLLRIYSDLSPSAIKSVDGVARADDVALELSGFILATIDKRYDLAEVIEEIRKLAVDAETKRLALKAKEPTFLK